MACTSQEAQEPVCLVESFRPYQSTTQSPPQVTHSNVDSAGTRALLKSVLLHGVGIYTADCSFQWSQPIFTADRPGGKSLLLTCQHKSRFNYRKRGVHSPWWRLHLKSPAWVKGEACATGPYRTPTTLGPSTKPGRGNSST